MWQRKHLTLRVGRHRVELWQSLPSQLELLVQQALLVQGPPDATTLPSALNAVWAKAAGFFETVQRPPALTVILESAWMPVMLMATGPQLWRAAELAALAKHRLSEVYGPSVGQWQVQMDHKAGESHALAFGLAPEVMEAIKSGCEGQSVALASIQPALIWGFNGTRKLLKSQAEVWWLWPEQDRYLLGCWVNGQIKGLHPAIDPALPSQALRQAVKVERERQGSVAPRVKMLGSTWDAVPPIKPTPQSMQWVTLIAMTSASAPSACEASS